MDLDSSSKLSLLGVNFCFLSTKFHLTLNFLAPEEEKHEDSDKEEGGEIQLEMVELTLGTLDLRESEIYPPRQRRRRRRKKGGSKMQTEGKSGLNYRNSWNTLLVIRKFCKLYEILHPCVSELSNTEADDEEQEVLEAPAEEDTPQEAQPKSKRKKRVQSKKQEGEGVYVHFFILKPSPSVIFNI